MDMMLIVYSVFFSKLLYANSSNVFSTSPVYMYIFFILLCMFMPWYMGIIYARYRILYGVIAAVIPFLVMILVMIFLVSFLFAFNEQTLQQIEITRKAKAVYIASALLMSFYMVRAFYVGYKTEKDMLQGNSFDIENEEYLRLFFFSFGISVSFIVAMIFFAQKIEVHDHSVLSNVGIMLLILAGGLVTAWLAIKMLTRLQTYFPIFIIALLICWNGIIECMLVELMKLTNTGPDRTILVIFLTMMGVIPFRIVLLFSPPLRGINLLIGIIAMTCYIYFLV